MLHVWKYILRTSGAKCACSIHWLPDQWTTGRPPESWGKEACNAARWRDFRHQGIPRPSETVTSPWARRHIPARCKACVVTTWGQKPGGGGFSAMPTGGRQGLNPPPAMDQGSGWQLYAIRYSHLVPFGMSYLSLPSCGVALPPGSSLSSPEARERVLVTAVSLFPSRLFIPGFPPTQGSPHCQMDDPVTSALSSRRTPLTSSHGIRLMRAGLWWIAESPFFPYGIIYLHPLPAL
ncbi:hypothetical protein L209DRAFT_135054 [Thermothelomyces heterothallicus CBS 203.75]